MKIVKRKEAQKKGMIRYFTGKPCKYGHVSERRTCNGFCIECEVNKQSSQEYKDYQLGYRSKEENKRKQSELSRKWREENSEYKKEKDRIYYLENKEHVLETAKKRQTKHKDKINAYYAKRRSDKLRATLNCDLEKIDPIYTRAMEIRNIGLNVHVDHIIPLKNKFVSGLHCVSNLQIIYSEDNLEKSNKFTPYWENHITGEIHYGN